MKQLFVLIIVTLIGCTYEPEHIDFEPFTPPEKIEQKVQELAKYMHSHPTDHTMLAEYGLVLSERFQTIGSGKKENKYIQYDRIDSIVLILIKNNGYNKKLFEKHIYNILLFTDWFSSSDVSDREFNSLYLQPLKDICNTVLKHDPSSATSAIGLCYYYKTIGLRQKYDSIVSVISGWKQIPAAFWRAHSLPLLSERTVKINILKTGDQNRKILSRLYGQLFTLGKTPNIYEISNFMSMPAMIILARHYPRLIIRKDGAKNILALSTGFVLMTQFYFTLTPFMKLTLSKEEFSRFAVKTTEEIFYSSGFNDINEFIVSAIQSGDTIRLYQGLEKYYLQYNGTILPEKTIKTEHPFVQAFLERYPFGKIILFNDKHRLNDYDSSSMKRWQSSLDSIKNQYSVHDRYISTKEIEGLIHQYILSECRNDSLASVIDCYCKLYTEATGKWCGSMYITALLVHKREKQAKKYLEGFLLAHQNMKEEILLDISYTGIDDYLSYGGYTLHGEREEYDKELYRFIIGISSENTILARLHESDVYNLVNSDRKIRAIITIDSVLVCSKRNHQRIKNITWFNFSENEYQKLQYQIEDLEKVQNRSLPYFTLRKAFHLAKMGRKTQSDSIFTYLESYHSQFIEQYAAREKLLRDEGKENDALELIREKIPPLIDQVMLNPGSMMHYPTTKVAK